MLPRRLIGVDLGTTAIKAAVFDKLGSVTGTFTENYPTQRIGVSIVEQNPEDWMRLILKAFKVLDQNERTAIGFCSQVNTHVFVDRHGNALCPAIVWKDRRASDEALALDARVTSKQKEEWWGAPMPIDASHAIARMAWVAKHQPDIWKQTRWVMLPKDFCMMKLTGKVSTDPLSNIGLVDKKLAYIPEILALVPGALERMAPLTAITDIAGVIQQGPMSGSPIISGTMDAWVGLIGTGGAKEQSSIYLSGTSEILGISSRTVVPTQGAIVFPEVDGLRLHAAPTQNGGDAKLWFSQVTGITLEVMSAMVSQTKRSSSTPLFLPQLEGERAPYWNSELRGAFLGVSRQTSLPDFARAVYEGVAFAAHQALDTLEKSSNVSSNMLFCGGGGFRSEAWTQIRANVLNKSLQTLISGEPGILGAVTLAALGTGLYSNFETATSALVRHNVPCHPDPKETDVYFHLFEIYKDAICKNAEIGAQLTKLYPN